MIVGIVLQFNLIYIFWFSPCALPVRLHYSEQDTKHIVYVYPLFRLTIPASIQSAYHIMYVEFVLNFIFRVRRICMGCSDLVNFLLQRNNFSSFIFVFRFLYDFHFQRMFWLRRKKVCNVSKVFSLDYGKKLKRVVRKTTLR